MVREYKELEKHICKLFSPKKIFEFKNSKYEVILSGIPTTPFGIGECKTDCYIKARNISNYEPLELKISIKMEKDKESHFLENKLKFERAKQIFGENITVIREYILKLKNEFEKKVPKIIDHKKIQKIKEIPLGWRVDIYNKTERKLKVDIPITNEQLNEIYKGSKLENEKLHAKIDNKTVNNSGIAEYLIFGDKKSLNTPEDVIKQMIKIDDYTKNIKTVSLAFNAVNLRLSKNKSNNSDIGKWDQNRPLAVYIKWELTKKKTYF
ncbi:MAG: hypothetical protein ACTSRG_19525 [Candidatus Helarchaeota archaeon]